MSLEKQNINLPDNNDPIVIIDKILTLYPQLQKDRKNIIKAVCGKIEKQITYVLERIEYCGNYYYKDNIGAILDKTGTVVGCYVNNEKETKLYFRNNKEDLVSNKQDNHLKNLDTKIL